MVVRGDRAGSLSVYRRRIRRRKEDNKEEEEIKEVVGGNSNYFQGTEWVSIPDELLFEVLLRLPAQDIYYDSRLVCHKWYHIVRDKYFIQQHLEHAKSGLLFKDSSRNFVFISAREDGKGIDTYKRKYTSGYNVFCSCNGLSLKLEKSLDNIVVYYVVNASTDQVFPLPKFPYPIERPWWCVCIGYDATSMTYKVVVLYKNPGVECAILTVGVDKSWRRVHTDHVFDRHAITSRPIFIEGFVHWNIFGSTKVMTLNLETEMFSETPPPIPYKDLPQEKTTCSILSTGRYLSLFLHRGNFAWEVFEMKSETGKWKKLLNICLKGKKERIMERLVTDYDHQSANRLTPCCWLKYPEVLAFSVEHHSIIFYNLITGEIGTDTLYFGYNAYGIPLFPHKNSLVYLGGP